MTDQKADVEWQGGVPVSTRFQDPYYSLENGAAEARHVFLGGNDLPTRITPGFHIAELGFGTGLNLLVTLAAMRAAGVPGPLRYTSFEAHPLSPDAMAQALQAFPDLAQDAAWLVDGYVQGPVFARADVSVEVILGDATRTLPAWEGRADAWYLDGFAPARNPGLWSPDLMAELARHTAPQGTAATYTAAGHVRRGLAAAGFSVSRVPGYGRKRHMTVARLP